MFMVLTCDPTDPGRVFGIYRLTLIIVSANANVGNHTNIFLIGMKGTWNINTFPRVIVAVWSSQ